MKIPFTKCQANGNDFIFIFAENINIPLLSGNVIRQLCSRHFGIGGDGLFIVSSSKESDFLLDYYEFLLQLSLLYQ